MHHVTSLFLIDNHGLWPGWATRPVWGEGLDENLIIQGTRSETYTFTITRKQNEFSSGISR